MTTTRRRDGGCCCCLGECVDGGGACVNGWVKGRWEDGRIGRGGERGGTRREKRREEKRREEKKGTHIVLVAMPREHFENNRPPSAKVFFWCVDSSEKSRGGFDRFTAERANVVAGGGEGGERGRRRGGGERKGQGKVAPTKVRQLHNAQRACDKTISR